MMRRIAIFVAAATLSGFAAGWLTAPARSHAPAQHAAVQASLDPRHGGIIASAAAARLTPLPYVTPPVIEQPPPPPPPPPDIAVVFRREISSVLQTPAGPVALMVDSDGVRRRLRRGDAYRDGWRITALSNQRIELRRQQERRGIDLFAPLPDVSP